MKRIIALTLALMLLLTLASCGKKEKVVETTPVVTEPAVETPTEPAPTEPAPTEPEWEPGIARAGYGEGAYETYLRGVEVVVLGEWKDYFVIEGEEVDLLIEKQFVRTESEDPFEERVGYAKWNTEVYDNVYREGESVAKLNSNKKVNVIDGKGDWLLIEWDEDNSGYVDATQINKWPTKAKSSYSGGGSSSSGIVGSSTGNVPTYTPTAYYGPEMEDMDEAGLVLGDGARGNLCITLRDDEVKVTSIIVEEVEAEEADKEEQEEKVEKVEIYLEGFYATMPRWLVTMEGDEEYEAWDGYARWNTIVYEEYQKRNEIMTLKTNDKVKVIDELVEAECYVIEFEMEEDGEKVTKVGYANLDKISKYRYKASASQGGGGGGTAGGGDFWIDER